MTTKKVLVLDAMGVIYEAGDDVVELLIPFAREHDCALSDEEIGRLYVECSLGQYGSTELWRRLGVAGASDTINERYLSRHRLNAGLMPFLREMRKRDVRVGCISNDVSEWSQDLRLRFRIETLFFAWTISGDVRIRKPDAGIYLNFLHTNRLAAEQCIFVDDRVKNLDSARRLGFETVWFTRETPSASGSHPAVSSFHELERWLA